MGGVPCIRRPADPRRGDGGRGYDVEEILVDYPDFEADDVREALHYAARADRERELPLRLGA
ncbi:MAG: DUF433 domain-containing protein [Acidimicrobiales bacterium]